MKNLNITFTDAEFAKIKKARLKSPYNHRSWEMYILNTCTKGVSVQKELKK